MGFTVTNLLIRFSQEGFTTQELGEVLEDNVMSITFHTYDDLSYEVNCDEVKILSSKEESYDDTYESNNSINGITANYTPAQSSGIDRAKLVEIQGTLYRIIRDSDETVMLCCYKEGVVKFKFNQADLLQSITVLDENYIIYEQEVFD